MNSMLVKPPTKLLSGTSLLASKYSKAALRLLANSLNTSAWASFSFSHKRTALRPPWQIRLMTKEALAISPRSAKTWRRATTKC